MTEKLTFPQWDEIAPKIEIEEDDEISEEEIAKRFLCIDCGKDTIDDECYMVTDELWAASGVGPMAGCSASPALKGALAASLPWPISQR